MASLYMEAIYKLYNTPRKKSHWKIDDVNIVPNAISAFSHCC